MSGRIWFEKEVPCDSLHNFSLCEFNVAGALQELQDQFDGLVCDVELKQGNSLETDKFVLSCNGRLNAKYQEMMRPVTIFGEFANRMLMTAITSVVDGALNLLGAK